MTTRLYSMLIAYGFRRSGDLVYRPHCKACSACIPLRIPAARFRPDRSQRRTFRRNQDISVNHSPAEFNEEHFQLFKRYLCARHADGSMVHSSKEDYVRFLCSSWCKTTFAEFRIGHQLAAVSVIDQLNDAFSAVYTFFDTTISRQRSLGVFAVLWQIQEAQKQGLSNVYLGYWIKACGKMSYKDQYRPIEAYIDNRWRGYKKEEKIL